MKRLALAALLTVVGCAQVAAPSSATAPTSKPATTTAAVDKWESAIAKFEAADRAKPMPKDAIVFYGSSSIVKWSTLATDFPGLPVVNRGFGGSRYDEANRYLDRVVIRNKPKTLVLYSGDNDLAAGHSPERVMADVRELVTRVHAALPETRIILLSIKPSPSRIKLLERMNQTNAMMKSLADADPKVDYIDVATPMLGADGQPRPELYGPDQLHMTPAGYELWTSILRPVLMKE